MDFQVQGYQALVADKISTYKLFDSLPRLCECRKYAPACLPLFFCCVYAADVIVEVLYQHRPFLYEDSCKKNTVFEEEQQQHKKMVFLSNSRPHAPALAVIVLLAVMVLSAASAGT
jgi:hypothetical protein